MTGSANDELMLLLNTAGWRPETLARKLTATLAKRPSESRFAHPRTPHGWLNHGDVPHPPIPDLVVLLLSEELGEAIPFDRVWPAKARRSALWPPADHGMDVTWSQTVRAMVQDRLTRCHAAAGDLVGVDRARTRARELVGKAQERPEQVPTWAYWVTRPCLDAHAGQALVEVANKVPGRRGRLLADSKTLLAPRAALEPTDRYQRSAVFHGTYLALAHLYAGELDQSVAIGRQALDRVGSVNSARSIGMLRQLRTELTTPARRNPAVRAFTTELDTALAAP